MNDERLSGALIRIEDAVPGGVLRPEHPDYHVARSVYFTGIQRTPAAVVRPRKVEEVAQVVRIAADAGVRLSIKGGGHGFAAKGVIDGAITLDLLQMNELKIERNERIAHAQAGLTTGMYTQAVGQDGLATGFGDSPGVGIAGITLAGGIGFLHRKFGLTVDSLLGAQVVTGKGEVIEVDETRHPDLFWALRGGGGNFGVVTRLDLRLHPLDRVNGGMLMAPTDPHRFHSVLDFVLAAPDEVSGLVMILKAPPMPMIPPELHGKMILGAYLVHSGDLADGRRWMDDLRKVAPPVVDMMEETPYAKIFDDHEGGPPAPPLLRFRSNFRDGLSLGEVEGVFDALEQEHTGIMRTVQFRPLGGAVRSVSSNATAFAHRESSVLVALGSVFADPAQADPHSEWVSALDRSLGGGGRSYAGFVGEDDAEGGRVAWPAEHRSRLLAVKERYDPENLFRGNVEISE